MKSFQVEFEVDDWKYIEPEIVTVDAENAEEAAKKALPAAAIGLRRQLTSLGKKKGRICVARALVFDNAEGDDAGGQESYWNLA
jgi:hypothetical protein